MLTHLLYLSNTSCFSLPALFESKLAGKQAEVVHVWVLRWGSSGVGLTRHVGRRVLATRSTITAAVCVIQLFGASCIPQGASRDILAGSTQRLFLQHHPLPSLLGSLSRKAHNCSLLKFSMHHSDFLSRPSLDLGIDWMERRKGLSPVPPQSSLETLKGRSLLICPC